MWQHITTEKECEKECDKYWTNNNRKRMWQSFKLAGEYIIPLINTQHVITTRFCPAFALPYPLLNSTLNKSPTSTKISTTKKHRVTLNPEVNSDNSPISTAPDINNTSIGKNSSINNWDDAQYQTLKKTINKTFQKKLLATLTGGLYLQRVRDRAIRSDEQRLIEICP